MGTHRLSVNKNSRHARCVKSREKPVYNNHKIKLLTPALEFGFFPRKPFIQIPIVALNLGKFIFRPKHLIVIVEGSLHFLLVHLRTFLIGYGIFGEIRKHPLYFLVYREGRLPILYLCQQFIIFLRKLDRACCKNPFVCHSPAVLKP